MDCVVVGGCDARQCESRRFRSQYPGFIRLLNADPNRAAAIALSQRVLALTKEIAAVDGEAALACFSLERSRLAQCVDRTV